MNNYTYEDKIKCLEAFEKKFGDVLEDINYDDPGSDLWLYNRLWRAKYTAKTLFGFNKEDMINNLVDAMFYLAQKISEEYKED